MLALDLRKKIVLMLLVFGLLPASGMIGAFLIQRSQIEDLATATLASFATRVSDVIDRNLFERYGDIQAFTVNKVIAEFPSENYTRDTSSPIVGALNEYMRLYGLYKLMMTVDREGNVVAVNSKDATGKDLETSFIYKTNFRDERWFKDALGEKYLTGTNGLTGTVVLEPAVSDQATKVYGQTTVVVPFSAPIKNSNGQITGVQVNFAGYDLVDQILQQAYLEFKEGDYGFVDISVLDPKGVFLSDYRPGSTGKSDISVDFKTVLTKNMAIEENFEPARRAIAGESGVMHAFDPVDKKENIAGYAHSKGAYDYPGLGWSVLVHAPEADALASVNTITTTMLTIAGVSSLIILIAGLWMGGLFAAPIRRLVEVVKQLADGKLHVEIPFTQKTDEVGTLARSMEVFRDKMRETEKLREEQELTKRHSEIENKKAMNRMADDFEAAVNVVVNAVSHAAVEMKSYAETLSNMADQTNQRSSAVAAASEQAAANVSTVAAATEELSSSIHEITRQVADSSKTASNAVDEAQATNMTISGLADAAQKIGDVTQLISEIANQTNLLALNATIEAARAGEAGKGFAVVASEVKNLASQTAKATEDITAQISGMQSIAIDAVKAIKGISSTIEKINGISSAIAAAVEEQGAATQEISRNVQEAAVGTKDVSTNITGVTQSAGETGQVANQVLSAAEQLEQESNRLKIEVAKFIVRVRAA